MQVIPAINSLSLEDAKKKIEIAANFSDWIHLDIVDGVFAPVKTWGSPQELKELTTNNQRPTTNWEIHLMVENPEQEINGWLETGLAKRIIVHLESLANFEDFLKQRGNYGAEIMLAIKPDTAVEQLLPYLKGFQSFQILAVAPGYAGQKFQMEVINKIKFLRKMAPSAKIEVDGGINPETAKLAKEAGADIAVSASYIFENSDPKKAYLNLR